ncbi:2OG-Fe dioxygenase family protein [Kitasatospora sp. NPDC056446]|uniref:2OG-Fe dioxygenase family protein n=1 Tax=Kitasatospora sp. NPDC056446 TaxID=3345819 RepID=UPI0036C00F20
MHILSDPAIATSVDVTGDIVRTGFSIVDGADFRLTGTARDGVAAFAASYDDLPPDPYLPDGGSYRYRRHTRYAYDTGTGELAVTENPGYFQTRENNPFAGGRTRKYEELDATVRFNPFLSALIAFNVGRLPLPQVRRWAVQAHCVRIVARADQAGRPTPEGVHRDGCTFISLHMVDRRNIAGGLTSVYSPEGEPITEKLFTAHLDSLYGEDVRIRHGVGDVSVADPAAGPGTRDMLLMSYDPL